MMPTTDEIARTTKNPAILERFHIQLITPELHEHTRVPLTVFRERPLSQAEYDALLFPLKTTGLLRTVVDETFTADEVQLLREFFTEEQPTWEFAAEPVPPIAADSVGAVVFGAWGPTGILHWPHKETRKCGPVELPIGAYFDLRAAEGGFQISRLSRTLKDEVMFYA